MKSKQNIGLGAAVIISLLLILLIWIPSDAESEADTTAETSTSLTTEIQTSDNDISETITEEESQISAADPSEEVVDTDSTQENDTTYEIFANLQENGVADYTLNEKATAFLRQHGNLFPTLSEMELDDNLIDYELTAKHISKNDTKYGSQLMMLPELGVKQIHETEVADGVIITEMNLYDTDMQQYYVLYIGELNEVFEGDAIRLYGLPLGNSSFENTEGGQTLVVVLAGCCVYRMDDLEYDTSDYEFFDEDWWDYGDDSYLLDYFILPYSDSIYYTQADLAVLSKEELRLARNEIYARHGRLFEAEDLNQYFSAQPWYDGYLSQSEFDDSVLNAYEKENLLTIKAVEAQR